MRRLSDHPRVRGTTARHPSMVEYSTDHPRGRGDDNR